MDTIKITDEYYYNFYGYRCPNCGGNDRIPKTSLIVPGDKFCRSCGFKIEWAITSFYPPPETPNGNQSNSPIR